MLKTIPYLRLVRSSEETHMLEIPNVEVHEFVTKSQSEAIALILKRWDKINILPGVMDVLEDRIEAAMKDGTKLAYERVAGMAEGISLLLEKDPRVERVRERAELLGREIGTD